VSFCLGVTKLADIEVFLTNEIKSQRPKNLEYWRRKDPNKTAFWSPKIQFANKPHKTQLNVIFYLVVNKLADIGVFLSNEIKSQRPKNLEYWMTETSE
jgi:hypothetical protein